MCWTFYQLLLWIAHVCLYCLGHTSLVFGEELPAWQIAISISVLVIEGIGVFCGIIGFIKHDSNLRNPTTNTKTQGEILSSTESDKPPCVTINEYLLVGIYSATIALSTTYFVIYMMWGVINLAVASHDQWDPESVDSNVFHAVLMPFYCMMGWSALSTTFCAILSIRDGIGFVRRWEQIKKKRAFVWSIVYHALFTSLTGTCNICIVYHGIIPSVAWFTGYTITIAVISGLAAILGFLSLDEGYSLKVRFLLVKAALCCFVLNDAVSTVFLIQDQAKGVSNGFDGVGFAVLVMSTLCSSYWTCTKGEEWTKTLRRRMDN